MLKFPNPSHTSGGDEEKRVVVVAHEEVRDLVVVVTHLGRGFAPRPSGRCYVEVRKTDDE